MKCHHFLLMLLIVVAGCASLAVVPEKVMSQVGETQKFVPGRQLIIPPMPCPSEGKSYDTDGDGMVDTLIIEIDKKCVKAFWKEYERMKRLLPPERKEI